MCFLLFLYACVCVLVCLLVCFSLQSLVVVSLSLCVCVCVFVSWLFLYLLAYRSQVFLLPLVLFCRVFVILLLLSGHSGSEVCGDQAPHFESLSRVQSRIARFCRVRLYRTC